MVVNILQVIFVESNSKNVSRGHYTILIIKMACECSNSSSSNGSRSLLGVGGTGGSSGLWAATTLGTFGRRPRFFDGCSGSSETADKVNSFGISI